MSNDHRRDEQAVPLARTLLLAGAVLAVCSPAFCQTSGSLTLASAYDARGVVLSSDPVVQARVEHDAGDGWYAGGFASPVRLGGDSAQTELIVYGGLARQLASGLSWDAGVSRTMFLRDRGYSYSELYAGLTLDQASARVFLSPDYFGDGRSAYLDLNAFHPLGERFRVIAHAGLQHVFGNYRHAARDYADVRLGLVLDLGRWSAQASLGSLHKASGDELARTRQFSISLSLRY